MMVTLTSRAEATTLWFAYDPDNALQARYCFKLGRASDNIDRSVTTPTEQTVRGRRPVRPPPATTVLPADAWESRAGMVGDKYIPAPVVRMTVEQFDQVFPENSHNRQLLETYVSWGDIEVAGLPAKKAIRPAKAEA